MKILVFQYFGDVIPIVTTGRIEALRELGHEVLCLDRSGMEFKSSEDYMNFIARVQDFSPDFVMFYGYIGLITVLQDGKRIPLFEKLGIPYAAMVSNLGSLQANALDSVRQFTGLQRLHLFVCDSFYEEHLRRMGFVNVHYLPLATSPQQFFPIDRQSAPEEMLKEMEDCRADMSFCGNAGNPGFDRSRYRARDIDYLVSETFNYRYRREILSSIRRHRVNCYGRVFNPEDYGGNVKWHDRVEAERLNFIYNSSPAVLNTTHPLVLGSIPTRVFDAMASGALVITDYRWELGRYFTPGQHLACFHDPREIDDLLEYYLSHEDERRRVAENGRREVLARHTWTARMEQVVRVMSAG